MTPHRTAPRSALLLTASPPGAGAGGSVRAAITLRSLRRRYDRVDVVSLSNADDERFALPDVNLVPRVTVAPPRFASTRALLRGGSAFVAARTARLEQCLWELQERGTLRRDYDLVWAHFAVTGRSGLGVASPVRVLDADLCWGAEVRRAAGGCKGSAVERVFQRLDAEAVVRAERRLAGSFDAVTVVSEVEVTRLGRVGAPVRVVPNTVAEPAPAPSRRREGMLFVGTLGYEANVDAIRYLVRKVLPRVRLSRPEAALTVVGRGPAGPVRDLCASAGVRLVVDAPCLDEHYATAQLVVAPLRLGGGTRIKLLEAMAHGLPIVATSFALEGLPLTDGGGALVGDDTDSFVSHCVSLLADPARGVSLGEPARAMWSAGHRPEVAEAAIGDVLDELAA